MEDNHQQPPQNSSTTSPLPNLQPSSLTTQPFPTLTIPDPPHHHHQTTSIDDSIGGPPDRKRAVVVQQSNEEVDDFLWVPDGARFELLTIDYDMKPPKKGFRFGFGFKKTVNSGGNGGDSGEVDGEVKKNGDCEVRRKSGESFPDQSPEPDTNSKSVTRKILEASKVGVHVVGPLKVFGQDVGEYNSQRSQFSNDKSNDLERTKLSDFNDNSVNKNEKNKSTNPFDDDKENEEPGNSGNPFEMDGDDDGLCKDGDSSKDFRINFLDENLLSQIPGLKILDEEDANSSTDKQDDLKTLKEHVAESLDTGDWIVVIEEEGTKYREINIDDRILKQKLFRQDAIDVRELIKEEDVNKNEAVEEDKEDNEEENQDLVEEETKDHEESKKNTDEFIKDLLKDKSSYINSDSIMKNSNTRLDNILERDAKNKVSEKNNEVKESESASVVNVKLKPTDEKSRYNRRNSSVVSTLLNEYFFNGDNKEVHSCDKKDCRKKCKNRVMPLRRELPKENDMRTRKRSWAQINPVKKFVVFFKPKQPLRTNNVQEIDGGFFEKFGSLLRQHTVRAALEESTPLAPLPEEGGSLDPDKDAAEIGETGPISEDDKEDDSGNETQQDTDSETDHKEDDGKDLLNDAVGWNIDELYEEVVFAVLHNVGCSGTDVEIGEQRAEEEQEAQLRLLCDAFRMSTERHEELLANARAKSAPEIRLNVEVVEGKDLHPKDPNGLSDPFVTLFLQSGPAHRYNTSVKAATLNPEWEEHFSLPLDDNPQEDVLCLEVWDFDPAETVREKIGKLFEVRGVKGFRKLMKEIAVTASTGKHDNELIGTAKVPLKSIPATGMTMWYGLDKKSKMKRQGVLKLRIAFSAQKDKRVAAQEHRHLLRILLLHELETSKVADYWWSGTWSQVSQAILIQHRAQGGLSHTTNALCEWSVYTRVHSTDRPLALELFNRLLKVLAKPLQQQSAGTLVLEKDEERMFWEGAVKLLPCCFQIIRRIRKKTAGDQASLKMLKEALQIIQTISSIEPPEGFDLLPARTYGWMKRNEEDDTKPSWNLRYALTSAIRSGARSWFTRVLDNNSASMPSSACTSPVPPPMSPEYAGDQELKWNGGSTAEQGEEGLRRMVRLMQLIRSDLQRALEYHDKIFQEIVNLSYASVLYKEYERLLSTIIKPEVETVCRTLHRVRDYRVPGTVNTSSGEYPPKEPTAMGTALFELYLVIKRFVILGQGLSRDDTEDNDAVDCAVLTMEKHHEWFTAGVAHWLDIAAYKATGRIDKAVELDTFVPVTDDVKYSSSAVDSLAIFYQIKIFWEQLEWPDVEGSYTFVAKIVDDICRCCVFYADRVSSRLDSQECAPAGGGDTGLSTRLGSDACSEKWCVAINNIDYVRRSLQPFVNELGVDGVLERLADYRSPEEAERCRATLTAVIDNNMDTVRNKILELIESLARKMAPALRRALAEGAELGSRCIGSSNGYSNGQQQTTECFAYTALLGRLENALATLHRALSSTNFSRARSALWAELSKALFELVQNSLEKRRPPSLYASLLETLDVLHESFGFGGGASACTSEPNSRCASPTPVQQQRARLDECREQEALDREQLEQIRDLLKLHALETGDLIHRYHLDRLKDQESMEDTPYGILTVKCRFVNTQLHVEVMNARNLKPTDSNGSCDPFVRISMLPEDRFIGVSKPKTQSQSKTMFPLFDETFVISLSEEHLAIDDALICFTIKDKDLFGMSNQYMSEAFMKLTDVPREGESIVQTHLKLSRPTAIDSETSKALENRQGDKQAREFLKKLKLKMAT